MNRRSFRWIAFWRAYLALILAAGLIAAAAASVAYANGTPSVIPPDARPHGQSYGDWSAAWWQWAFSLPTDGHPLLDTADCSEGQSGRVWFLGGTFTGSETTARDCTVPTGTSLFFPIVNVECSTLDTGLETEEELRSCANFTADFIAEVHAELNGVAIQNLLERYRVESPLFTIGPMPEMNILAFFGLTVGAGETGRAVGGTVIT